MINLLMADDNSSFWPLLLILGLFMVGMFVFSILPQRRKQKQMADMSSRIKVGDKIRTIGGLYGTIVGYDEERNVFTILSGNSTFEIDRGCVYSMEMMGIKTEEQTKVPQETPAAQPEPILEETNSDDTDNEKHE